MYRRLSSANEAIGMGKSERPDLSDCVAHVAQRQTACAGRATPDRDGDRSSAQNPSRRFGGNLCAGVERRPESRPGAPTWAPCRICFSGTVDGCALSVGDWFRPEWPSRQDHAAAIRSRGANYWVEHRDRLARFGSEYIEAALAACGSKLVVVDQTEMKDDLVQDMVDVVPSLCARLYGRRAAKNRAAKALAAAQAET